MDKKTREEIIKKLHERFEFRMIRQEEAIQTAEIELACFPPNEACSEKMMIERVKKAPEMFLVAVDKENKKIAGFINGLSSKEEELRDDFFEDADLYDPDGKNIMILGLDVLPAYQRQGLGRELMMEYMRRQKSRGIRKMILTCHKEKISMYEKMGYQDRGIGISVWGGSEWHEMYRLV